MKKLVVLILLLITTTGLQAQGLSTNKKKSIELYTQADNYRVRGQFQEAVNMLREALDKDEDFHEAWVRLGQTFKMARQYENAIDAYKKAVAHNPKKKPLAFIHYELGDTYLSTGDYDNAVLFLEQFINTGYPNKRYVQDAEKKLEDARFALKNQQYEVAVQVEPLSDMVNCFQMQYFPVLTADKQSLIYTRRLGAEAVHDEDLVISTLNEKGEWASPHSLSSNVNTELNEGTSTISADGRTIIFTSCYGRESLGNCDLYITYKAGEVWSIPINMGENINSSAWDSQPSLSADGRTLFFVSNRGGGVGKIDIWYSRLGIDGRWDTPVNAGSTINTLEDEVSPFLHANHQTLFFSSKGHKGFGGFDIFKSEWSGQKEFSTPENIGAPINNAADQISVFITADGEEGYYSYETYENDLRRSLIYSFQVPEHIKPEVRVNYVKGTVKEKNTGKPLAASIELFDVAKNEMVSLVYSDSVNGNYLMVLPEGSQYALYVSRRGYLFENKAFNYKEEVDLEPLIVNFELQPINKGASVVLNNIFFDFDSYTIRKESYTELEKIEKFLKLNPQMKIEIAGHTDNRGTEEYNMTLSHERAKAVYSYLLEKGIPKSQITFSGYAAQKPLVSNDSEENRQTNRRIEFVILDK